MKYISFTYLFAMLLADSQNKTALIKVRGSLTSVGKEINIYGQAKLLKKKKKNNEKKNIELSFESRHAIKGCQRDG
jgi:hypothetical protein